MTHTKYKWQLVVVLWGEKYAVAEINALIKSIRSRSTKPAQTVLVTDRPRDGLIEDVLQVKMPQFFNYPIFMRDGCQAKLSVFELNLLPSDLPTVLLDIDTLVMGDLSKLIDLLEKPQTVAILQSAILPFGAFSRSLYKITNKRRYARGNSSVVVFNPSEC